MKKYIALLILSFVAWQSQAEPDLAQLQSIEQELNQALDNMRSAKGNTEWNEASDAIAKLVQDAMNTEGCFEYPFSSITRMGILKSPDNKVKMFNWNIPRENSTHGYRCFIMHKPEKKEETINIYELIQSKKDVQSSTSKYLALDDWYGALYYEIIPVKQGKKTYYTLLGWAGKDISTTQKIVDALQFTSKGARLGAPVFKTSKGTLKRFVLEFADEVVVSLKYFEKDDRIVFDHLSPSKGGLQGQYAFYGPDFTYDCFVLEKGKWIMEPDIDVRQGKDDKPFVDPR